ncbi:MAG: hypothetical protein GWP10_05360 [Nitrospiraceae bacterium]|nr:hypothetical protein [Nitrospiraceae bacterium]
MTEQTICNIDCFSPGISGDYRGLFSKDSEVWIALDRLKGYICDVIRPNLFPNVCPGVPLTKHLVLLPQGWLTDGFDVVYNKATKGRLQVWIDGKAVPQASLICAGTIFTDSQVEIGKGVIIEPGAMIKGPCIIGDHTEVRQAAYIRGDCLIGKRCVVGHATEVKHSVFLDGAKAGHFAYIGDSLLGMDVNLGAGTKLANLCFVPGNVSIKIGGKLINTGRRKFGAILGNNVQTGCNSVTNPGVLLGPGSLISPGATVMPGFYTPHSVIR